MENFTLNFIKFSFKTKSLIFLLLLIIAFFSSKAQFNSGSDLPVDGFLESAYVSAGANGWSVAWDNNYFYVHKTGGGGGDGMFVFLDVNPIIPVSGGTNANGSLVGPNHYGQSTILPFRVDVSILNNNGGGFYQLANGAGGWGGNLTTGSNSFVSGGTREFRISWTSMGLAGRPASFNWCGYMVFNTGNFESWPNNTGVLGGGTSDPRFFFYQSVVSTANDANITNPFNTNFRSFENRDIVDYEYANTLPSTVFDFTQNRLVSGDRDLLLQNDITIRRNLVVGSPFSRFRANGGNRTITFTGSGEVRNSGTMFGEFGGSTVTLTFSNGSNMSLTGANNIDARTFNINSGAVVDAGTQGMNSNSTGGVVTISGTLRTANANGLYNGTLGTIKSSNITAANVVINAGSTIEYNSSGAQTVTNAQNYSNLTVSNGNTKTLGGAITVNGDLTIGNGSTLDASPGNDYAINLAGNWSNSGTFTPRNGTVTFNGVNTSITGTTTFGSLIINKTASNNTLTLGTSTNVTINQALTLSAGILSLGANTLTVVGGVSGPGSFAGTTSSNLYLYGGPSTLRFEPGSQNLSILWVEGVTTLATDLAVHSQLNIWTGGATVLQIAGNTLSFNGFLSGGGNLAGSPTSNFIVNGGNNTFNFSGTGTNNYLKNLTLNNSAVVFLGNLLNITGGSNPGVVTLTGTSRLITNGNLVLKSNAGGTASVSEVTSTGTAPVISGNVTVERYIPQAPINAPGLPTPPQTGRAWRLLTIPVTGTATIRDAWAGGSAERVSTNPPVFDPPQPAGIGTIITGHAYPDATTANNAGYDWWSALWIGPGEAASSSIRRYRAVANYQGDNWPSNVALRPVINTQLNNTDGAYMLFVRGDRTVTTGSGSTTLAPTGSLRIGDVVTPIPSTPQFFTYGNPYAATIDFGQLYDEHNTKIEAAMHVWDATLRGSNGLGGYRTITKAGNDWVEIPVDVPAANKQYIHSSQGVMLKTLTAASGSITTKENYKVSGTPAITPFEVTENNFTIKPGLLFINLHTRSTNGQLGLADGVLAVFDMANKVNATDKNDISKIKNFTGDLGIALNQAGQYLTMEGRPVVKDGDKLFIATTGLENMTYAFTFKPSEMLLDGREAFLIDKFLKTETPISLTAETSYNFEGNSNAASKAVDRFEIVFKQATILPVTITRISASEVQGNVKVNWNSATESGLKHYDVEHSTTGREFAKLGRVNARNVNGASYDFLHQQPGIGNHFYRLRSEDADGKTTISQIVKVSLGKTQAGIVILPNIINSSNRISLQLNGLNAGKYRLQLTDMVGRILFTQSLEHYGNASAQTVTLPATLAAGKYLLHITGNENSFTEALIKQ